jgi:geranylgeranyl diphosphate synthase, type II
LTSLTSLRELIEKELMEASGDARLHPEELYAPITYTLSLGGKRTRPLLVLVGCEMFGGDLQSAIHPALAIELFHNFTLLHDDLMDKAPLRRNKPTVHEKWNQNVAVLSGDAMFVKSYQQLCQCDPQLLPKLLEIFNDTALKVCEGQQLDMNYETSHKVSIPQYLKMIELKTAVLLGASLKIGALAGKAREEDAEHLYQFGKNIGIAFQLQDDLLVVYADIDNFGKQQGGDIISNKKTFLLLKSLELANNYLKEELNNWIYAKEFVKEEKVDAVMRIYDFLGIKNLTEKETYKYYERAIEHLNKIPVSEEAKSPLISLTKNLMIRKE